MAGNTHLLLSSVKTYKFDFKFLQKFWYLCRHYLSDKNGSFTETLVLFIFVLLLSVIEQFLGYNIGMITSVYYKIMGNKDLDQFLIHTLKCIFLISSMSVVKSSKDYVSSSLQIAWREKLTEKIHEIYFNDHLFYNVNILPPSSSLGETEKIDNPDQRITQDVSEFTKELSSTVPKLLIAPFLIGWYSFKSYSTTGGLISMILKLNPDVCNHSRIHWTPWLFYILLDFNCDQQISTFTNCEPCIPTRKS